MKRRTILTGAVTMSAARLCPTIQAETPQAAIHVAPGKDRFQQPTVMPAGNSNIDWKVSAKDTNGAWSTFESQWRGKGGPPRHLHRDQDEWFYIVESEFIAQVGQERFRLKAGDAVFAPRQLIHTFAHVGDGTGKMIVAYQPAGTMEEFFREQSQLKGTPSGATIMRLYRGHGLEIMGPPLEIE